MNKLQPVYLLTIFSLFVISSCVSQSPDEAISVSQSSPVEETCTGYYPLTAGSSYELTQYDKKDKLTSVIKHTITDSKSIENGIEASCNMIITDQDGNQGQNINYNVKCQDGKYYLDMGTMLSEMTSQYEAQGMEVSMEDGVSVIPNNLSVGDELDDVTMTMNVSSSAINLSMTITLSERTIIGTETITTSAGTYDCMILSQKTTSKMGKMVNITTSSKEWLSKGVGIVRSENFDKKGKLESYSLLTAFSK